ncbi:MAG: hypothetical protein EKK48_08925 [Candidatus Melainabacteria bacterium]|nr:MAG: hypothetical protein EKK48_08925 [Candidatus Melainabacteria bacterium]
MKTINAILAALAALFQSPEVAAAKKAQRRLADNNSNISAAEQLLAAMKAQRIEDAKADAAALEAAIAAATSEAEKAELRRQAELDLVNDQTDARIKALEEAIAAARQTGAEKLGRIAEKQAAERTAEKARRETAEAALEEVSAAAGNSAK